MGYGIGISIIGLQLLRAYLDTKLMYFYSNQIIG